ncbi:LysR family transcriptional regulator [Alloalcanivorax sp. C16-2]|uniref:LysR family transcriptional regulator n=1 Tax=Alloalcanivorax sp. C16-2 TaxID=3390052 RepID=UPI003970986C
MMKNDNVAEMKVFKSVVDLGGFTACANHLGVSQSYVSKTVSGLEARLGIKLIHRNTRNQKVTEEGVEYLEKIGEILGKLEEVEIWAYRRSQKESPTGEIRLTAPLAFGIDPVSRFLPEFLKSHPSISLNLSLTDYHENLLDGTADMAIRMGPLADSSLVAKRLCKLNRLIVASPEYLDGNPAIELPDDLLHHECLLWSGDKSSLNKWRFMVDGMPMTVTVSGRVRSTNGVALIKMCQEGMGVMRMAEHVAVPLIKKGKLRAVLETYNDCHDDYIYIVFPGEKELNPRFRSFVEFMVDKLRYPDWQL